MHIRKISSTAVALVFVAGTALADFETDFGVAWDGQGQLQVEFNFDSIEPIASFITDGGANGDFTGWFSDEPGFANFDEDEPDEGLFVVPDGTVVGFELVAIDPAFRVYDPFFDAALNPSDTFILGDVQRDSAGMVISGFDDHPFWAVDSEDPSFDENVFDYSVSFRLFDARNGGNAIAPTEVITVQFTRIPSPAGASLLAMAGLAAARRRR